MAVVRGAVFGALGALVLAGHAAAETNPAPPLAAEALPQYHVGDSLTYDNNGVERTVVVAAVDGDEVTWTDKAGSKWVGSRDPSIPPRLETPATGGATLTRSFDPPRPTVFPLVADKEVTYNVTVQQGEGAPRVERNSCRVRHSHKLTVEAGTYTAWEIACQRGDGLETLYYAPEVGAVLERDLQGGGTLRRVTLANYHRFGEILPALAVADATSDKDASDQPAETPAAAAKPAPRPPAEPTIPVTAKALPAPAAAAQEAPPAAQPEPPLPVKPPARAAAAKPAPRAPAAPAKAAPPTQLASLPAKGAAGAGPAASPEGKFLVQFVAFGAPEEASRSWDALRNRLPALLARLKPRYDTVTTVGGMKLARLSLGPFASEAAAKDLCTALHAAGPECWVRPLK